MYLDSHLLVSKRESIYKQRTRSEETPSSNVCYRLTAPAEMKLQQYCLRRDRREVEYRSARTPRRYNIEVTYRNRRAIKCSTSSQWRQRLHSLEDVSSRELVDAVSMRLGQTLLNKLCTISYPVYCLPVGDDKTFAKSQGVIRRSTRQDWRQELGGL